MALGKINAMANISDQTKNQRNQFAGEEGILGANRSSAALFSAMSVDDNSGEISIDEVNVNDRAQLTHITLYSTEAGGGVEGNADSFNPDFPLGHLGRDYGYAQSFGMLDSSQGQTDRPNRFGPNLIPPSIDASGEVATTVSEITVSSPVSGRGFGVNLDRQNPDNFNTLGSYLNRRRNDDGDIEIPKGEFVDEEKYDWEQ
jgi:hypothetical protein